MEIEIDWPAPQIIYVDRLIADVERQQHQTVACKNPPAFEENRTQVERLEMHDGVERHDSGETCCWEIERLHIAYPEFDTRAQARRAANHFRREVDTKNSDVLLVQMLRYMARPAAQIGDEASPLHGFSEAVEDMAVQGFLLELQEQVLSVCAGRRIVTGPDVQRLLRETVA